MNKAQIGVDVILGQETGEADVFLSSKQAVKVWMELNEEGLAEWLNQYPEHNKRESDGKPFDLENEDDFEEAFRVWEEESFVPGDDLDPGVLYLDDDTVREVLRILIIRWGRGDVERLMQEAVELVVTAEREKLLRDLAYAYVLLEREEDHTNEGARTFIKRYVSYEQIDAARVEYERTEKEEAEDSE